MSDNLCTFGFSFSVDILHEVYKDGEVLARLKFVFARLCFLVLRRNDDRFKGDLSCPMLILAVDKATSNDLAAFLVNLED